MTRSEYDLLHWLNWHSPYWLNSPSTTLDALVERGLAKIHDLGEHQETFIAKGSGPMYRAVSITEKGRKALADQEVIE